MYLRSFGNPPLEKADLPSAEGQTDGGAGCSQSRDGPGTGAPTCRRGRSLGLAETVVSRAVNLSRSSCVVPKSTVPSAAEFRRARARVHERAPEAPRHSSRTGPHRTLDARRCRVALLQGRYQDSEPRGSTPLGRTRSRVYSRNPAPDLVPRRFPRARDCCGRFRARRRCHSEG